MLASLLRTLLFVTGSAAGPEVVAVEYGPDVAAADAKLVLTARGQDYLQARARLEAHPAIGANALLGSLDEPLGPAERARALSILSAFRRPEVIPMFADLLRRSLLAGDGMDPWRTLLVEQGGLAAPAFRDLAGDTELAGEDRAVMLDDLVTVVEGEQLPDLVAMLGRGDRKLQGQLRRSLARRGRANAEDGTVIVHTLDTLMETGDPRARAAAIQVRTSLADPGDPELEARLLRSASDETSAFIVRVAAIRALGEVGERERDRELTALARQHLAPDRRGAQASELLGWLALQSVGPAAAASVVDDLDLVGAEAPRLAALGYRLGTLGEDDWIGSARRHPWPQVRSSALRRVEGPCARATVKQLAAIGGPLSDGGEADATVARAAIAALGRCGDPEALDRLADLLHDDGIGYEQRAEAARQLVEHGGAAQTLLVTRLLEATAAPAFAERLAGSLARARAPDLEVHRVLCATTRDVPRAAATARHTLDTLFPGERCAAEE